MGVRTYLCFYINLCLKSLKINRLTQKNPKNQIPKPHNPKHVSKLYRPLLSPKNVCFLQGFWGFWFWFLVLTHYKFWWQLTFFTMLVTRIWWQLTFLTILVTRIWWQRTFFHILVTGIYDLNRLLKIPKIFYFQFLEACKLRLLKMCTNLLCVNKPDIFSRLRRHNLNKSRY